MGKTKLNPKLLAKMAQKSGKRPKYLREQISRRGSSQTISSLAAQLLWAKEMGIGIAVALKRAEPSIREEVQRAAKPAAPAPPPSPRRRPKNSANARADRNVRAAIDFVLEDQELLGRCRDLLLARKHYDRVVREATTVLDDRLKKLTGIPHMNPVALVAKALNPDPSKAILVVSAERDEQQGIFNICNGVTLAFRNRAHHNLSNAFSRADLLKVCGFVDALLAVIGKAEIHRERT